MQVQVGPRGLHGSRDVEVGVRGDVGGQHPLHAQLGRAELPRVVGDGGDVGKVELRRVGGIRCGAEPAGGQVAVDDQAHGFADGVATHVVCGSGEGVEVGAGRPQQVLPLAVVERSGVCGGA